MIQRDSRVRLVATRDPYTQLRPGDEGTVTFVDSLHTIHVRWDSGSSLGMIPGEDLVEEIEG